MSAVYKGYRPSDATKLKNELIVLGVTGPVMVYDEALFQFSKSAEVEFLPWRVWISFWALIIAATVACFQGSFIVKYFTKFTKDIFAAFIATVFIYEALLKTAGVSFLILLNR